VSTRRARRALEFERRHEPLAPPHVFRRRLIHSAGLMLLLIGFSLVIGVAGYHEFAHIESWVDCLYNAAMILGGMGPVAEMPDDNAKIFASAYAIYSGVVLLASVGVLISPVLHRILHRFHIETDEDARS
jgi:ABC-type branched-subunit amino acid transport system permease subunit